MIPDSLKFRIENIVNYRLEKRVSNLDVFNWLCNFEEIDWNYALDVLEKSEYYSFNRIMKLLRDGLDMLIKDFEKGSLIIYVVPIGNAAKSGYLVDYIMSKIIVRKEYKHIEYLKNLEDIMGKEIHKDTILLMVDDIIASGGTVVDFLKKEKISKSLEHITNKSGQSIILSILLTEEGRQKIENEFNNIKVRGDITRRCFSQRNSVFGYYPKMVRVREFCYKYGDKLSCKKENILGYKNSQCLVIFEHATPNNTLPIIWASKKNNGDKWYPLFPRFAIDRINKEMIEKRNIYQWISVINKLHNINSGVKQKSILYAKTNFLKICILSLVGKNISLPVIANSLAITESECMTIIKSNESKELFVVETTKGNLMPKISLDRLGEIFYNEIKKEIAIKNQTTVSIKYETKDDLLIFVPENFQGLT